MVGRDDLATSSRSFWTRAEVGLSRPNNKSIRSDKAHPEVWDLVSGLLSEPERLLAGLDAMIDEQRGALRGDPEGEAKAWLEKLAALDRNRSGYLDLATEGIMGRDELRIKLTELQEDRETAERELAAIEGRREQLEQMERDRETVMEYYAGTVPETLDDLSPEERHKIYKMLRLEVLAYSDKSLEVSGAILAGGAENEGGGLGALEPTRRASTPPWRARFIHWLTAPLLTPRASAMRCWDRPCCLSSKALKRLPSRQSVTQRQREPRERSAGDSREAAL